MDDNLLTSSEHHRSEIEHHGHSHQNVLHRNRLLSSGISSFSGDFTPEELTALLQEQYRQDKSSRRNRITAVILIYISVLCEMFSAHSVYIALLPYLVNDRVKSDTFYRFMYLLSYTVAFLSGFFTDKRVSRYWTIFWGFVIFISGYTMLFLTTDEKLGGCQLAGPAEETDKGCHCGLVQMGFGLETEKCACLLASSIVIMSIGIGLVLVNSSIFGADQIQSRSKFIPIYFHGYYFVVQVGIGLSCFFLPQEKHSNASFVAGLGLASAALSFTVFLAGGRFYQNEHREKLDDPFRKVIDTVSMSVAVPKSAIQRNQSHSTSVTSAFGWLIDRGELDRRIADDVRMYLRMMLIFLSLSFFEFVLFQQDFLFDIQGHTMKLPHWALKHNATDHGSLIVPYTMKFPLRWLTSGFNLETIIILIPIIVALWVFSSKTQIKELSLSIATVQDRLIVGLLCSAMSLVAGGLVTSISWYYFDLCTSTGSCMELYHDGDLVYAGRGIYVKWETIQCVLGALSEILVRITAYQLAYLEAPDTEHYKMHGMFVCLLFLAGDIGVALSWASVRIGEKFFCDEILAGVCQVNMGNLVWYFYGLAAFQLVGFIFTLVTLTDYFHWRTHGKGYPFKEKMEALVGYCCLGSTMNRND